MSNDFEIIFDNGGGTTIQTDGYCHFYVDPDHAATDLKELILNNGDPVEDGWGGNEPEHRLEFDPSIERNGGYYWLTRSDIEKTMADTDGVEPWGYNHGACLNALGVKILDY